MDRIAHHAIRVVRPLLFKVVLVVLPDAEVAVDGLHVFSVTRNGHGLVDRFLAPGGTGSS